MNTVTATYNELADHSGIELEDSDDHETNLIQPDVVVTKDGEDLAKVGDTVTYTIEITNFSSDDTPDLILDEVAARLKGAEYDRLEIVGHTDRIGTEVYNQYLSERRAWAVARYLIQQGVPVNKLAVEGRGMHEPLTSAQDCTGLSREETITCLQTDRRVVISASIRRVDVNVH